MKFKFLPALAIFVFFSCYEPERNCGNFRQGTFTFTAVIGGESRTTNFRRNESMEIDYFEGKADTASIRWINDCEYVVRKLHPTSVSEQKSIHFKILSTTADSYTFEYSIMGSPDKSVGTAYKVDGELFP
jgi:hypothetical protein